MTEKHIRERIVHMLQSITGPRLRRIYGFVYRIYIHAG